MGLLSNGAASLGALTVTLAASCYSPELQDCAVSCSSAVECAPGQTCGEDGWCVGGGHPGPCATPGTPDGGPPSGTDELRVIIAGQGQIELDGVDTADRGKVTCVSRGSAGITCTYPLTPGTLVSLKYREEGEWRFSRWDAASCLGRLKTCVLRTAAGSTSVQATFIASR